MLYTHLLKLFVLSRFVFVIQDETNASSLGTMFLLVISQLFFALFFDVSEHVVKAFPVSNIY